MNFRTEVDGDWNIQCTMRTLLFAMPQSRYLDTPSIPAPPSVPEAADDSRIDDARIRAALDQADDAIGITDSDLRLVYCNAAFRTLFETRLPPPDSVEPGFITDILGPDVDHLRQHGRKRWTHETTVPAPDGAVRHILARISVIPDGTTKPSGLTLIVSDMTTERQAEALLQRRLTAMEATSYGIMTTDPAGFITYVNPAQCRILGASRSAIRGKRWDLCLRPIGSAHAIYAVLATTQAGNEWRGEIRATRSAGTPVVAETTLTGLPDGGHVWIQRDATEKKRQDCERARLQRQSQQARKLQAIGRLAGGVAHDFNNLLVSILGYAGFLKDDLPAGSREQGYARQIIAAGERGRDLIGRLLSVSRRPTGERRPVDLNALVREALTLTAPSIPKKVLLRGPDDRAALYVNGNETELVQAVMNLCLNARDAVGTSPGCISVDLRRRLPAAGLWRDTAGYGRRDHQIRIGNLATADQYAVVSVADTGIGISPAILEEVVEPFYTTKPSGEGTGLGLATVNGIVAAHGGALTISTTPGTGPGAGTTVQLAIPAIAEPELPAPRPGDHRDEIGGGESGHRLAASATSRSANAPLTGGNGAVLVIDDDAGVIDLLAENLERIGIDAVGCNDPIAALSAIQECPTAWQAILVDQIMPQKTGLELVADLRRLGITVPAVLMSANAPAVDFETLRRMGIVHFIAKPIGTSDLRRLFGAGPGR